VDPTATPDAVVFVHIHKTAGTTLRSLTDRQYRPNEIASVDWKSLEAFKASPEADRARIRLLRGHMPFGLHEFLPRPSTYITLMREPLDRAVSHYYWVRERPEHDLKAHAAAGDLVAYLESGVAADLDNGQVRLIAGAAFVPFGEMTEAHLEQAVRNLDERFALAGLSERFDETLVLLRDALGWHRSLYYTRQNPTRGRPRDALDARTADALRAHNRLDLELYGYATDRFARRVAAGGEPFAREVSAFARTNRALNRVYPLIGPPRRAVRALARRVQARR
jgi:hypothetical protein